MKLLHHLTLFLILAVSLSGPTAGAWSRYYHEIPLIGSIAGTGESPSFERDPDGSLAVEAAIDPWYLAIDRHFNIYYSDITRHAVYKINSEGRIERIAGAHPEGGYSGDGGPAINADLYVPRGLAVDRRGNIYIADLGNNVVRKIDIEGIITTVAGGGEENWIGYEGPGTEAFLGVPHYLAVDYEGDLFIYEDDPQTIRRLSSDGQISHYAGIFPYHSMETGGLASHYTFGHLGGMVADRQGNLYVSDMTRGIILKIDRETGIVDRVAGLEGGDPWGEYSGEGGPAIEASLGNIAGLSVNFRGDVFIATLSEAYGLILKVDQEGIISTIAGGYEYSSDLGDCGLARDAYLLIPISLLQGRRGNLIIGGAYTLREIYYYGNNPRCSPSRSFVLPKKFYLSKSYKL